MLPLHCYRGDAFAALPSKDSLCLKVFRTVTRLLQLTGFSLLAASCHLSLAQTVDYSSVPVTKPITVGTSVPVTCQTGQLFFNPSALPGQNLLGCVGTNVWVTLGGITANSVAPAIPSSMASVTFNSATNSAVVNIGSSLSINSDQPATWTLVTGSAGTMTQSGGNVVYTPPATLQAHNAFAGCMVAPNDSIFNTAIDKLPVHTQSASWLAQVSKILGGPVAIGLGQAFGVNILDNSVQPAPQTFHYTTIRNGAMYQIAANPHRKRETGALTTDGNNDHHMISVNWETCHFYETYQEGNPGNSWTAASGWDYDGSSYTTTGDPNHGGGSTDAAGLPMLPLLLHLSDLQSGEIKHAMRFTSCVGCIAHDSLWPAIGSTAWGTGVPPMGSRWRLKASVDISKFSPKAQIILRGLQRYGMVSADVGSVNQIQVSSDFNQDPKARAALNEVSGAGINTSQFEVVDESSLMLSSSSYQVNPQNAYVTPDGFAMLTGKAANGKTTTVRIALQPVLVGVPYQNMIFQAGTGTYQLLSWVKGTRNQTVKWSLDGPGWVTPDG